MLPNSPILPVEKRRRPAVLPLCEEVVIGTCRELALACQASVSREPGSEARLSMNMALGSAWGFLGNPPSFGKHLFAQSIFICKMKLVGFSHLFI